MTLILAVENNDKVYIAADSLLSRGNSMEYIDKITKINNKILFAYTGDCLFGQIAQDIQFDEYYIDNHGMMHFLINHYIPRLKNSLILNDIKKKDYGEIVIAYDKKVYYIDSDFFFYNPQNGIAFIGSGKDYAYGAYSILNLLGEWLPNELEKNLSNIISSVSKVCLDVGGKIIIEII